MHNALIASSADWGQRGALNKHFNDFVLIVK